MPSAYFIILFFFLFTSCDHSKNKGSKIKKLNLCFKYNPLTIDPKRNSDPLSCSLINMLFEGLVHLEKDGSISLALAKSVHISKNKRRYTFELKEAYWSNGDPITSYDFLSSWKKILDPNFPSLNAYFLYPIKNAKKIKSGLVSVEDLGVYTPDAKTLVIKLEHPSCSFLKMLAFTTCFPTHHKDETLVAYSGPFILDLWKHNDSLILKKNPKFWNATEVLIDEINIQIIEDAHTSLTLHEKNELDFLGSFFSPIPHDALETLILSKSTTSVDSAGTSCCFFNVQSFPFNNVNIRKAFAYAINKEALVAHICQNQSEKAYGLIPPLLKEGKTIDYFSECTQQSASYFFELGLKELGIDKKHFPKLIFSTYQAELEKNVSIALQHQWQEVLGVSIKLEHLDVKIFLDKLYKRNYQFCLMSIVAQYFDAMNFLERFIDPNGYKNFTSWYHPKYTKLLELSEATPSSQKRGLYLEKAEALLLKEFPIFPLFHSKVIYLKNPKIDNIEISPIGCVDFRYASIK